MSTETVVPGSESTPSGEGGSLRESLASVRESGGGGTTDDGGTPKTRGEMEDFIENATEEELAFIKKDPILSKVYNSMNRDYKGKTTKLSEREKALKTREEELNAADDEAKKARELFDALRDDPDGVLRAIAERRGMTLQQIKKEAKAAETDEEMRELFGDDAEAIAPAMNALLDKRMGRALQPIMQHLNAQAKEALAREISNDLEEFQRELKESGEEITPEIEAEMDKLTKKIDPGPDTTNAEYIRMLYRIATAGKSKDAVVKEVSERMRKAAEDADAKPVPSTSTKGASSITPEMNLRQSLRAARADIKAGR